MSKYLHLKFLNAALYLETKGKHYNNKCSSITNVDLSNPIGVRQAMNMLLYMFGYPPVPTKRESIFHEVDYITELAKEHTYIKYYSSPFYMDSKGEYRFLADVTQTAKPQYNSDRKVNTKVGDKIIGGELTWQNYRNYFKGNKELYQITIDFFNDILGCKNVFRETHNFPNFLLEMQKHTNDEKMIRFKEQYGQLLTDRKNKTIGRHGWYDLIFNGRVDESISSTTKHNCDYKAPEPLLNTNGVGYKICFNGEIIIEIEDDNLIDELSKYGSIPSILDGGIIQILGITNLPPNPSWKDEFTKISEYNSFENN